MVVMFALASKLSVTVIKITITKNIQTNRKSIAPGLSFYYPSTHLFFYSIILLSQSFDMKRPHIKKIMCNTH